MGQRCRIEYLGSVQHGRLDSHLGQAAACLPFPAIPIHTEIAMLDILAITGPIYLTIAAGYLAVRLDLFAKSDMQVLGRFVLNLALPCMIFGAIASRDLHDILHPAYLFAYAAGSLLVLGFGFFWSRTLQRESFAASTLNAMGMSCANSGYVGFPILLLTLPSVAATALALNVVIENILILPLLLVLAEHGQNGNQPWYRTVVQCFKRLITNPLVIALMAGMLVSLLSLKLPEPLTRTTTLFAQASSAISLFVIGGTLTGLSLQGMARQISPIIAGKLLLHPLAVGLCLWFGLQIGLPSQDKTLQLAALLSAAMPMMGIYPILAQRYGLENIAAAASLGATIISFFTLSAAIWGVTHFAGFAA